MDWGTGLLIIMLRFDHVKYDVFRDPKTKCTCCQIDDNGQAVPIVAIFSVELECEPMILALSQFYRSPIDTLPTRPPTLHYTTNCSLDHDPQFYAMPLFLTIPRNPTLDYQLSFLHSLVSIMVSFSSSKVPHGSSFVISSSLTDRPMFWNNCMRLGVSPWSIFEICFSEIQFSF